MHMAPCVFQLFFLPVFCWLCCILVPSLHLLWKQGGLNEDFSMSITVWLYLSFSFSCCWYTSASDFPEYDCEVGCVILMSKKVSSQLYSTVLLQRYPILHCQQCWLFFHSQFSLIGRSVGLVWTSLQTSLIICASVSHRVVPHWSVATQFTYEAVIHRVCLSTGTVGGYAFHLPSISHADGISEFLLV